MLTILLVTPGLIVAYVMLVRPMLRRVPAFQAFWAEADGFWAKLWAICGCSLTMAWSYVLLIGGGVINQLDNVAAVLGDPNFKQQVSDLVGADPKVMGIFMMAVSVVTIATRLRSIGKAV
jgi:hypothetical protein